MSAVSAVPMIPTAVAHSVKDPFFFYIERLTAVDEEPKVYTALRFCFLYQRLTNLFGGAFLPTA